MGQIFMGFTIFEASVSDYAVTGNDVGTGSLLAALADAGFIIGLKRNRFVILVPAILSYLSMCY
jgi:alpha-N-arabinofuranosidase